MLKQLAHRGGYPDGESAFTAGRSETVRYHEGFYAATPLGAPGSWLSRPDRVVLKAIAFSRGAGPILAYDLGAGIGRHTIPMAQRLAGGSRVIAVDMLPSAIRLLETNCSTTGLSEVVTPIVGDLAEFAFEEGAAGLIVGFSAVEHLSSAAAMRDLLLRCVTATAPGGLIALGILADRAEQLVDGTWRPALVEFELESTTVRVMLDETFSSWTVEHRKTSTSRVREQRDGTPYELTSTLIRFIGRRATA